MLQKRALATEQALQTKVRETKKKFLKMSFVILGCWVIGQNGTPCHLESVCVLVSSSRERFDAPHDAKLQRKWA